MDRSVPDQADTTSDSEIEWADPITTSSRNPTPLPHIDNPFPFPLSANSPPIPSVQPPLPNPSYHLSLPTLPALRRPHAGMVQPPWPNLPRYASPVPQPLAPAPAGPVNLASNHDYDHRRVRVWYHPLKSPLPPPEPRFPGSRIPQSATSTLIPSANSCLLANNSYFLPTLPPVPTNPFSIPSSPTPSRNPFLVTSPPTNPFRLPSPATGILPLWRTVGATGETGIPAPSLPSSPNVRPISALPGPESVLPLSDQCWNCRAEGHRYTACRDKFCYGCGRGKVTLRTCRTCSPAWLDGERLGHSSPLTAPVPLNPTAPVPIPAPLLPLISPEALRLIEEIGKILAKHP